MPKNIIPKQNFPKVEEIRYLENQNQKPSKKENSKLSLVKNNQKTPTKKVLEWLVWKNKKGQEFYRVFGSWKCDNKKKCGKGWNSAYTWILLQKYKEDVLVKELDQNKDYYQQECKACSSKINRLIKYEHLKLSENQVEDRPHLSHLCAKCQESKKNNSSKCQEWLRSRQQVRRFSLFHRTNLSLLSLGKRFFRF